MCSPGWTSEQLSGITSLAQPFRGPDGVSALPHFPEEIFPLPLPVAPQLLAIHGARQSLALQRAVRNGIRILQPARAQLFSDAVGMGLLLPYIPLPPPFISRGAGNTSHSIWAASPTVPRCQKVWLWEISPQCCIAGLVP